MTVLAILGSRNPNGQTAKVTGALRDGVKDQGGECEQVFLPQMKIERCRQCEDDGWGLCRKEGRCVIEDNFSSLVDKLKKLISSEQLLLTFIGVALNLNSFPCNQTAFKEYSNHGCLTKGYR